jgi:hypothetical protein
MELYERMLKEKDEMMGRLERLIEKGYYKKCSIEMLNIFIF